MARTLLLFIVLLLLNGCATGNHKYGNYTDRNPQAFDIGLAQDAASELATEFPPARTQFDLGQTASDPFGQALISQLRGSGYAVMEYSSELPDRHNRIFQAERAKKIPRRIPNVSLTYVLDRAGQQNFYRLTLLVAGRTVARPYSISSDGSAIPVGYWTWQE